METAIQYIIYLLILIALAIPLGRYIGKVMNGEKVFLSRVGRPCERLIYRLLHIDESEEMTWKRYALSAILF
ncbi:MAG TPA: potassium-transporting ATPase subunit KdpA, partial [Lachnospiraceae bacterium]|nr:potassium-transporting ATPase subunit KdpA [Lachnospiraceae bacterium]